MLAASFFSACTKCRMLAKLRGSQVLCFRLSAGKRKSVIETAMKSVPVRNSGYHAPAVSPSEFGDGTAVTFQVAIKAGTADAKDVRRAQPVSLAHLEHALDVDLPDFLQRDGRQSSPEPAEER